MAQAETTSATDYSQSLNLPVGAFSPLWLAFAGAAATGAAFFWMSRWMQPVNLEAQLKATAPVAPPPEAESVAETVLEPLEAAAALYEPAAEIVETAIDTVREVAAEQTAALVEAAIPAEPVVDHAPEREVILPPVEAAPAIDDLTRLVGIGPKLAVALAERGVTSFAQIAAWSAQDLAELDEALSLKGRAVRDAWVAQAKRIADAAA